VALVRETGQLVGARLLLELCDAGRERAGGRGRLADAVLAGVDGDVVEHSGVEVHDAKRAVEQARVGIDCP